ncbi:MAG: sugar ABC transporter permease [Chloroflexi bacterium]|nr:sugar ABC transporter permease [Anaerolineaceae bacterium]NMB88655.1 sugar ABC transporter permease [Chloroflexota bacterium]
MTTPKPMRRRGSLSFSEIIVFVVPILFFIILLYVVLLWTIYVSFTDWKTIAPNYQLTGLKWYQFLVAQPRFEVDVLNNLKWLIAGVVPTVVIAILLAYLLELTPFPRIESYIRTLILYPVAMSFIVTGTIWSWMYEPQRGVFNTLLRGIGIDAPFRYATNPTTATYWLVLIFIWQYLGFSVIIIQSSFRTTELQELIEAARVDGASRLRILVSIIIPNIRSGLLILVSLLLISTLKVFDIVFIVTYGGPGISTDVLALNMWITTFQQHLVSAGAGLGVIIFFMAFILVIPYTLYALRKWFE